MNVKLSIYNKIVFLVFLLIGTSVVSNAQSKFYSSVNTKKVSVGDIVEYKIIVENAKSISNVRPPKFVGLRLLGRPSQSSSSYSSGGKKISNITLTYRLSAVNIGKFNIGKASAIVNGKKTFTKAKITIEISQVKENQMFIRIVPSDSMIFVGQQFSLNYVVYSINQINQGFYLLEESDYKGFYTEKVRLNSAIHGIEEINGIQYHSAVIMRLNLFPQQTGRYDVSKAILRPKKNHNKLFTNELSLLVRDVPSPRPKNYLGVGNFRVSAKLDRRKVHNNKVFNLFLTFESDGDPKMFYPPQLDLDKDLEIYEPVLVVDRKKMKSNVQYFTKQYKYTIVPKKAKNYSLRVLLNYYNPDSLRYMALNNGPYRIQVVKGNEIEKFVEKDKKEELKSNWDKLEVASYEKPKLKILNFFLLFSFISVLGMFGFKYYQIKTSDERSENKRQRDIHNRVLARLNDAKSYLETDEHRAFYDEIFKAIQKYLSDKFGMEIGNITVQNVNETLLKSNIDSSLISSVNTILEESQVAIFGGLSQRPLKETYDDLVQVIEKLENA